MRRRSPGSTRHSAIAEPVALVALALDAALGWPAWLYARVGHPVGAIARVIAAGERRWNAVVPAPPHASVSHGAARPHLSPSSRTWSRIQPSANAAREGRASAGVSVQARGEAETGSFSRGTSGLIAGTRQQQEPSQLDPGLRSGDGRGKASDEVAPAADAGDVEPGATAADEPDHLTPAKRRERRLLGAVTLCAAIVVATGTVWLAERGLRATLGAPAWLAIALLAWPGLAQRSLDDHVRPVAVALERDDLAAARVAVGRIVGRDTVALDNAGVARAAIESLAESFCDAVTAPLFWLLLFGPAGLWGYKAINTADSLIGHREPRWRAFGWAAARTDDLANWLPARLGGALICVAGGGGWRVLWRDSRRHASPNAGWTEAAMAGVLGVRLAGPVTYDGAVADKPWIGDGRTDLDARDIRRALFVYRRGCLLLWCLAGAVAWAR